MTASLEKRIAWLENLGEVRQPTEMSALKDRVAELEKRVEADGIAINQLFTRIIILETAFGRELIDDLREKLK